MYHLQERDVATGRWERLGPRTYRNALDALEARDELLADSPNNGIPNAWRVVSDAGEVIEYSERTVGR